MLAPFRHSISLVSVAEEVGLHYAESQTMTVTNSQTIKADETSTAIALSHSRFILAQSIACA